MKIWVDMNHAIWGKVDNLHILDLEGEALEEFINLTDPEKIRYSSEDGHWLPTVLLRVPLHYWENPDLY